MAPNFAAFEAKLAESVERGEIAGAVALVADRGGITYETAAGRRSAGGATPMDADTVFWIASMTKAITSVAALQQVERGALSLDADVADLLPEFRSVRVLDGKDAAGKPLTRPPGRPVTLRHLLTHTSGSAYPFFSAELTAWIEASGSAPAPGSRASYFQPLLFDPGEGWTYGYGVDWAGMAVEAVTGKSLGAYLEAELLGPLGMAETTFHLTPELIERRASVHLQVPEAGLTPIPFELPADREVEGGGGDLYGTLRDYSRFARMLLNDGALDGARVLNPETVSNLARIQTGSMRAGAMSTSNPFYSLDYDPFPGQPSGWGLTGVINPEPGPNGRGAGSLAWAGLANSYYFVDRAKGVTAMIATQMLPFGNPAVLSLFGALERGVYGIS